MKEQDNSETPFSIDHYSGNCSVYFKGDYDKCEKVKEFLETLQKKVDNV